MMTNRMAEAIREVNLKVTKLIRMIMLCSVNVVIAPTAFSLLHAVMTVSYFDYPHHPMHAPTALLVRCMHVQTLGSLCKQRAHVSDLWGLYVALVVLHCNCSILKPLYSPTAEGSQMVQGLERATHHFNIPPEARHTLVKITSEVS